ncbi:MAG: DNA repair protein RecO C-terminal domain-containing protein [Legionellales bacterium]|nr:DNA repair protein RecO C-terminal domain-containing protein [Legionellales bacterium]
MNTDAWLLYKSWSGETSARVVFFTKLEGIVSCFYKGARQPKKQALLQSFTPLWLEIDVKGTACFVRHIEATAPSFQLTGDALFAGMYVNELLFHALKPHDAHISLYRSYQLTLTELTKVVNRPSLEALLRRFEWDLLKACGYAMSLTHDAYTRELIQEAGFYSFIPGDGFVSSENGILGAHLLAMSENQLENLEVLKVAKWIMRRAISHALDGQEIKTRALMIKVKDE